MPREASQEVARCRHVGGAFFYLLGILKIGTDPTVGEMVHLPKARGYADTYIFYCQ